MKRKKPVTLAEFLSLLLTPSKQNQTKAARPPQAHQKTKPQQKEAQPFQPLKMF